MVKEIQQLEQKIKDEEHALKIQRKEYYEKQKTFYQEEKQLRQAEEKSFAKQQKLGKYLQYALLTGAAAGVVLFGTFLAAPVIGTVTLGIITITSAITFIGTLGMATAYLVRVGISLHKEWKYVETTHKHLNEIHHEFCNIVDQKSKIAGLYKQVSRLKITATKTGYYHVPTQTYEVPAASKVATQQIPATALVKAAEQHTKAG